MPGDRDKPTKYGYDEVADDSVLYDETTGRTYYLDDETGAYYYYDEKAGDYVYYEGEDDVDTGMDEAAIGGAVAGSGMMSEYGASSLQGQRQPSRQGQGTQQGQRQPSRQGQGTQQGQRQPSRQGQNPQQSQRKSFSQGAARPASKKKNNRTIIIIAVVAVLVIGAIVAAVTISNSKDKNTYEGQMRIGVDYYKSGEYDKAADAFNKALEFKPGDANASIALADTYSAQKKYDKAVSLLEDIKTKNPKNADVFNRLLTLYISNLKNIDRANELIIECFENKIDPKNDLVMPAPVLDPEGGSFEEPKSVNITVTKDYTVRYTKNGKIPTAKSTKYKSSVKLSKSGKFTLTAAGFAENGLMTWPVAAEFKIDIKYVVDSSALDYLGSTAKGIMNSAGPLYYRTTEGGGLYYSTKDNNNVAYIFEYNELDVPESTNPDEEIQPDPQKYPLKSTAKCVAVNLKIGNYVPQLAGNISVDEFAKSIGIKNYKVSYGEESGSYHLYYTQKGLSFDYTLSDKNTVSASGWLLVK